MELRSGAFTGVERIQANFPDAHIYLHARPELKNVVVERYSLPVNEVPKGTTLFVNARETLNFNPDAFSSTGTHSSSVAPG